jgi:hypothetical protein
MTTVSDEGPRVGDPPPPTYSLGGRAIWSRGPFFYMGIAWTNLIWFGQSHYSGHSKGWALKSQFFQAQMALVLLVAISGPKKVLISGPTPSNSPCNLSCPHKNNYVLRHIHNRYISRYIIPLAGLEIHHSISLCHLFNQAPLLLPPSLLLNCLPNHLHSQQYRKG